MIGFEKINYINIDDIIHRYNELTGMIDAGHGLWTVDWTKQVYDVSFPIHNYHFKKGESSLQIRIEYPEDLEQFGYDPLIEPEIATYNDRGVNRNYYKIEFLSIMCWLMKVGELPVEDAIYWQAW